MPFIDLFNPNRVLLVVQNCHKVDRQSLWCEIAEMYANKPKEIATFDEPDI